MNGLATNAGRVGDIRDTGAVLKFNNSKGYITAGLFNGNGEYQNTVSGQRYKFADFSAYFTGIRHLSIGAFGGTLIGDTRPYSGRDRLGASIIYSHGPHFFETEGAFTRDYAPGDTPGTATTAGKGLNGRGGYALYAYKLSKQWQLVGRADIWDLAYQGGSKTSIGTTPDGTSILIKRDAHTMHEYTIGFNYYINADTTKIQLNYIYEDPETNAVAYFGRRRSILAANFQVAW